MKATTERAFEAYIQESMSRRGWVTGSLGVWDKERGLFPEYVVAFIRETQAELWGQMERLHGKELYGKVVEALVKEREIKGTIAVLRHGFKFYGKTFRLAYFKPAHGLVSDTLGLFGQNQLHVTRQVPCHPKDNSSVDMVLSLNGIPVATVELKNPSTGQTWKEAMAQYKKSRDPRTPLFQFKRGALVHFAVDTEEIYMCTRLEGEKSFFLPFNRGSAPGEIFCGRGNPLHASGHRTGYFWEKILERESFMDIVGNFIFLETREEIVEEEATRKRVTKETLVFPRYHQLDAVRKLMRSSSQEGAGHNYLIQHSAGSGKTNSISWLSHRLANLHNQENEKVFDCVVVITDRRVLDRQLQDAIYQIEHAQGVVKAIDENSRQLSEALVDGTKIIITTLQKFPFILRGLLRIAGAENPDNPDEMAILRTKAWEKAIARRKYAILVDEAHSSQSGDTAKELKRVLGGGNGEEDEDFEDVLGRVAQSRGRQKNLSFFAFTATPKGKTIELFGRMGQSGKPEAFHTYSMKQAMEEGFILDVLQRYTTYKTYIRLIKSIEEDPSMPEKKAKKKLGKFLALHPYNIEQKTEIIVEHFREHVKSKLFGRAKAMVVTGSRLHAVRYMISFRKYLEENHYSDIKPLVAFSGVVKDTETGMEYKETSMNLDIVTGKPISESQLPERFDSSDYQILLVANKYQTGFDQPRLCAMYVDKRLDGVQAVQTLSRLNRTYPGKEAPFILDFENKAEDIYTAFKPYYDVTTLCEPSDPDHLEKLKHELNAMQVYLWSEVEGFCHIFYLPQYRQNPSDHARMQKMIQPATDRFQGLSDQEKESFYGKITAYTRFYSFISQIIPYYDIEWEMLYGFARYLIPHLHLQNNSLAAHPEKDVDLQYYRIEKVTSGSIVMEDKEHYDVKSPTAVGTGKQQEEQKPLSQIIQQLNDRFGTNFAEEDRLFFEQIKEKAIKDERIVQTAQANPLDKFELGIKTIIESLMMQRMFENDTIVSRYMDDKEFQKSVLPLLAQEIYKNIEGVAR